MQFLRLIKYDVREGTIKCWYKYSMVLLLALFLAITFHNIIADGLASGSFESKGSILDYILYAFQGMQVYHFNASSVFSVPIYWFAFQIMIAYIIAYYPDQDFHNYGVQKFLCAQSRIKWWCAKCVWCIVTVVLYFLLTIVVLGAMVTITSGDLHLRLSGDIMYLMFGDVLQYMSVNELLLVAVLVPFAMTTAVAFMQLLFSFVLTPVSSFACTCILYVLSAYYTSSLLIGNFTMWQRSKLCNVEGVDGMVGLLLALVLIVGSFFAGCIYFERCDVY